MGNKLLEFKGKKEIKINDDFEYFKNKLILAWEIEKKITEKSVLTLVTNMWWIATESKNAFNVGLRTLGNFFFVGDTPPPNSYLKTNIRKCIIKMV